ncbi:Enabled-like protein [Hirschfeldia incana]|nr:Enabled-like protein [Hirschfeldia incana]
MDHNNALLTWANFSHGKTMEELRQTLVYTTMELEQTKLVAQEELRKRDEQLIHLEETLAKTLKERDEALEKCHNLIYDNLLLQPQHNQDHVTPPLSGASSIEEDEQLQPHQQNPKSNKSFSSSDTEESIMSPSVINPNQASQVDIMATLLLEKSLPEKGSLLQAVLKAGPLLQTLLLAGPLPQWRHPPPPLETSEIPPVTVPPLLFQSSVINSGCGNPNKRRAFSISDGSYSETKYESV